MKWRTVFIFYALACCISWWVMMPLALNHHQVIHFYNEPNEKLGDLLHALAAPGPYLAAIIMIAAVYKRPGLNFFLLLIQ